MAGVVRLDKVKSVYHGNIWSVVHNAVLENGFVVKRGTLKTGERELYNVATPTAGDGDLALIAAAEVVYDNRFMKDNALGNFSTPAGTAVRAYEIAKGDIISISYDALTLLGAAPVVGNYVVAQAGLKLKEAAAVTTEKFQGKIIALEQIGVPTVVGQAGVIQRVTKFAVIEVLAN
jgi:hypothetical protein